MIHRLLGQPLALEPRAAQRFLSDLSLGQSSFGASSGDRGYDIVGPVAVIGVYGLLLDALGMRRPCGRWATGYDGIRANLAAALDDAAIAAIVLHVDSPGGLCAGLFDLVDAIFAAKTIKPIIAICESAYSAAYAIASSASFVTVSATGGVGSIGVLTALTDISKQLAGAGVEVVLADDGVLPDVGHTVDDAEDVVHGHAVHVLHLAELRLDRLDGAGSVQSPGRGGRVVFDARLESRDVPGVFHPVNDELALSDGQDLAHLPMLDDPYLVAVLESVGLFDSVVAAAGPLAGLVVPRPLRRNHGAEVVDRARLPVHDALIPLLGGLPGLM